MASESVCNTTRVTCAWMCAYALDRGTQRLEETRRTLAETEDIGASSCAHDLATWRRAQRQGTNPRPMLVALDAHRAEHVE